jgi:hypothetical protein
VTLGVDGAVFEIVKIVECQQPRYALRIARLLGIDGAGIKLD